MSTPNEIRRKIVIVGSGGRIGAALTRRYQALENTEVLPFRHAELDLCQVPSIEAALLPIEFDLLINAAAMTNVDACEEYPETARLANVVGPARMAEICRDKGARMFHISTDYVFDGASPGLRYEWESPNPIGVYGRTKLDGECEVLRILGSRGLVLRTSWVFGPDRPSFPDMILDRALKNEMVEAIDDKWSCPCYSEDFAAYVELLFDCPEGHGVLHLCNSGSCSWYDYGQSVLGVAEAEKVPLKCHDLRPISLAAMKHFLADRPVHTAMSTARFAELTGVSPRGWSVALREYLLKRIKDENFR